MWPPFNYRNTIVLQKYVWPQCNYLEGFNYEEPSSGVDPLLSHGCHLNQQHFWDQFIARLFTFCLSKAIKSKMCCLELFSFFWNLCGQCSCFQANTPWGASLPAPLPPNCPPLPLHLLSIFPNMQQNTQRGHSLEPHWILHLSFTIPIWQRCVNIAR